MEFEEVKYGMLMMVLCDRWGRVYDVWISYGSVHEVRAFRERKRRSIWFRKLVENSVVYGDRGYRGCEGVIVCDCREMRAKRQVVEGCLKTGERVLLATDSERIYQAVRDLPIEVRYTCLLYTSDAADD